VVDSFFEQASTNFENESLRMKQYEGRKKNITESFPAVLNASNNW